MAKILVVDDDYIIRTLLRRVLTLHRHNVVEASDGMEALDAVDPTAPPDLIFMDLQMPRLSGIDCAKQLKIQYPSLKIILITGSTGIDADDYLAANKNLFTDVMLKPFSIKHIMRAVENALGVKARERIMCSERCDTVQPR
jgi:CheY-like chemotaxis protein